MRGLSGFLTGSVLGMAGRRSPWGNNNGDGDGGSGGEGEPPAPPETPPADKPARPGPRNPWLPTGDAPEGPRRSASIEDILRQRGGGGPGGRGGGGGGSSGPRFPQRADGKSWMPLILLGLGGLWLIGTTSHMLGPKEQGIVTTFGKYSRTIGPGVSFTLPWPLQAVEVQDVTSIKRNTIPEGEGEKLMLTSDQNLIDISYLVRWKIDNLKLYSFQLEDPEASVIEVAESAMRASVAEVPLNGVMGGSGRAQIEQNVRERMQALLNAYRAGVQVLGVEIKKADPPDKVNDAFQKVTAAQQDAQRDLNNAQAWAQQTIARAQGDAASFDKVYEQYRLAPDVTRRRMYYETMERVLSSNDKVVVEGGGVTPYLPLPEVRRKQTQTPEAPR